MGQIELGAAMATRLTVQGDPSDRIVEHVAQLVRRGGVAAIPTESFYALGAAALDAAAVRRVHAIKGRTDGKPILVVISDRAQLDRLVAEITP
ncbi:MAG: Sua5/YciO/YrdC/YwlC family protein, partial [Nitrospiraceae bacterium]